MFDNELIEMNIIDMKLHNIARIFKESGIIKIGTTKGALERIQSKLSSEEVQTLKSLFEKIQSKES